MSATKGATAAPVQQSIDMRVSLYDRVASWIIALNILVGFGVLLAFLMWLSHVLQFQTVAPQVELVENIAGRGDHAAGFERDVEAPGVEELEEETEPAVQQLLEAVTDVVSTQAAALDSMQTTMFSSNTGKGLGDSRPPGPLGEGDNIIPRWERWEVRYNTNSFDAYIAQLDYFGIELGAVGGGEKQIDYASHFSKSRPDRRSGPGDKEKRLYLTWSGGTLKRFDQRLLQMAGIRTKGRIIMQFYPKDVENRLANIELAYARKNGKTSVKQIRKTVFGVRRKGSRMEFYVISQKYRAVPA